MNSPNLPNASLPRPTLMQRITNGLDTAVGGLCTLAMALAALGLIASLGMVVYSVAMRYLFNLPQTWVDDLVGFLLVAIVLLGAGDVMRRGEHIGVDLLTSRLGPTGRRIAAIWALLAVIVTATMFVIEGLETVGFSKMLGIVSQGHLEIPIYLVQLAVPIGGALFGLAAVASLLRAALGEDINVSRGEAAHTTGSDAAQGGGK